MPNDTEEDFAALLAEYEQKGQTKRRKEPQIGEEVKGRVVSIGRDAVFIDCGGKSDGMIELTELRDEDGKLTVGVGDELEARVVETSGKAGCVVLRRTVGRGPVGSAELEQAFAHQIPVEGLVTAVNKGGVEVQVAGVRAFCPISQLDLRHVEDAAGYIGQRLTFRISRYETGGPRGQLNLVVSRRALLEEEARTQAAQTRARLALGAVMKGKVTALKEYGAFVDLGGIEGMLHISELGFQRVAHPKDLLTVGQELEVQVVRIEKSDDPKRPEKVALSLKSLERDPWAEVDKRFPEGMRAAGTVARLETFGAFVEVAPGVEGLVHVSELGQKRHVRHAKEVLKLGQRLEVMVLAVDADKRRLSLGLADAREDEEAAPGQPASAPSTGFGTLGDLLKKKP
jgi:small subunit ribosomal protein S1